MELLGITDAAELKAAAVAMRAEASKMAGWRQKAMQALLGTPENPKEIDGPALLQGAVIRDEQYDNQGYKDQLVRTQILALVIILSLVMAIGFVIVAVFARHNLLNFSLIALFGLLGATISGMIRAYGKDQPSRIPELTAALRVMFMRILMGSATAIVVYVFLKSQLVGALGDWLKPLQDLKPFTTYAVAFISGTSERFVMKAVEQVAGKTSG